MDIQVDYSRDSLFTEIGYLTLKDRYMLPGETSPQDALARAAKAFCRGDYALAQRIYDYASKHWFMFSTPILTNAGTERGLGVSCFLNMPADSRQGLSDHFDENIWLSSIGGGIGGCWSNVRSNGTSTSKGSKSTGIIPFIHVVDSQMLAFSQGVTRRGSYAAYLDISHPEIEDFIVMRKPSGGDPNRKCLNIHNGVVIPDSFMQIIERCIHNPDENDDWPLIDPHTKEVVSVVSARRLWEKILDVRVQTGEPYILFIDTINNDLHPVQKQLGYKISQSNLCTEITEYTSPERTASCILSSVNALYFNEWVNHPTFIPDLITFLDNVNQHLIDADIPGIERAQTSAFMERSLGLGLMGFHSYLQKMNIPITSPMAKGMNIRIFKHIKTQARQRSVELAKERGPCGDAVGINPYVRNIHLLAIAPNASSSLICGQTSPSIEPYRANVFIQKTTSGSLLFKNPQLEKKLQEYGQDKPEVWKSILENEGSVSHLDFMSDWDKDVFKTALEIDQRYLVDLAGDRQEFICQAQSLNLFFHSNVDIAYLHHVHFRAWKNKVKSLYYLRSVAASRVDNITTKIALEEISNTECLACEG